MNSRILFKRIIYGIVYGLCSFGLGFAAALGLVVGLLGIFGADNSWPVRVILALVLALNIAIGIIGKVRDDNGEKDGR